MERIQSSKQVIVETISLQTTQRNDLVNITTQIKQIVRKLGIQEGVVYLHVPHTTAGITINENADPDVVDDILLKMNEVINNDSRFRHGEGNSDSHIKSSLFGPTLNLIVSNNELVLGTWQGIYFCEFDGARKRKVFVKVVEG